MRRAMAQCLDEPRGIGRHVIERIGLTHGPAREAALQHFLHGLHRKLIETRGGAHISVVKAGDSEAARRQIQAKSLVPHHHLSADAHDEHDGFTGPECLVR